MNIKTLAITFILLGGGSMAFAWSDKKPNSLNVSAELQEEVVNHPLNITGEVPRWLSGTLVRNGPISVTVNGKHNAHWFDGLAMLHAFSFQEGNIHYTNKFLRTDAYRTVFEEGSIDYEGFASDPCRSLFKRFFTFFFPSSHPVVCNANVNVAKLADAYVALTETPLPVKFDLQTLDTLGVLNYQDELPKEKCWESAHPHYDAQHKRTWNYLIKFGRTSYYTLYYLEDGAAQRKVVAEIPVDNPSYMHSFALTDHYVIFTEFPFVINPLDLIMKKQSFIKNFTWQPQRGTQITVIDRQSGKVVGKYVTKPFFAFHHANAFEKEGMIHMDIVTYKDASILSEEQLTVDSINASRPIPSSQLERFSLSLKTGAITSDVLLDQPNEFPRINDQLDGKPHRYVYVASFHDQKKDGLSKVNTETKEVLTWSEKGCSPGEPIFVAAPQAKEEDEGVVLAVVLDSIHNDSFLLILDGKSFQEIGRARAPHLIPTGLHGQYFQLG